jgi:hypothetical protein
MKKIHVCLALSVPLFAQPALALDIPLGGETTLRMENLFTVGGLMRMQDRDPTLISKSNLQPGICVAATQRDANGIGTRFSGDTCTTSGDGNSNRRFVAAPGSFSPNGDNGNLNFDRYDFANAAAKLTTDWSAEVAGFNTFFRTIYFFDARYSKLQERHPDTTLQLPSTPFPDAARREVGADIDVLDYFVSRKFSIGERNFSFKLGNQVLNWGESAFLLANSLNSINPPDQSRLRVPGFDVKELAVPVGMALLSAEITQGVNLDMFYQYKWRPVVVDPVGSFFSVSDTLGAGGQYAMLSFSKAPEDPAGLYQPNNNANDPIGLLGSTASRTVLRDYEEEVRRRPRDGGQYGASVKLFLENFNNGTEVGFYFANYHARVPTASFIASQATCIGPNGAASAATFVADCGFTPGAPGTAAPPTTTREPIPVDTARVFVEYPENIKMYGVSFNTTVGDIAVSGEYAFRSNLPIQIHTTDLTFAALQPAFPVQDVNLGATTIPGRRSAVPDFVETNFRGRRVTPGMYIPGFERMKIGQAGLTLLKTIGGDNPFGATQITLLLESGYTHLLDFPDLGELQFQGAGVDTHISNGGDGTRGTQPRDVRMVQPANNLLQNPTTQDASGFGTKDSYGYRLITLTRFDSALFGANIELLNGFFHDVKGVSPGLGLNFIEGRKQVLSGIRWDYLAKLTGELRYTWNFGGGLRDPLRDRDNLFLFLGYQF